MLPLSEQTSLAASVLMQGMELNTITVPLHQVYLRSSLITGPVVVGVRSTLPVTGLSFILGNDLAGGKVKPDLWVVNRPDQPMTTDLHGDTSAVFPACVMTRAAARKARINQGKELGESDEAAVNSSFSRKPKSQIENDENDSFKIPTSAPLGVDAKESVGVSQDIDHPPFSREQLIHSQEMDPEFSHLMESAIGEDEVVNNPDCYYKKFRVLMQKWRPPDVPADEEWQEVHQIVVPKNCREEILNLAHGSVMAGHLGINKTYHKILTHFYWPGMKKDVVQFCRSCHVCQLVGKPNQPVPSAPLQPIPVCGEPFSHVLIDCVGPLPKTKLGNQYLLTIMCKTTRFPEAVPLRNIEVPKIVESLIKFFTFVGLPVSIQPDQGSNFMSNIMQQVMYHQLGIKQYKSSAYHPESQGAIERYHQTLKNFLRVHCLEYACE